MGTLMTLEFYEKYKYKIKTLDELKKIIGAFPRDNKVIMCHGCFDVVHPGHVHHLAYAKSRADQLLVSITSDRHIQKGKDRPHVPEYLRALNLAAFEMVDYVIIDDHPTPISNLKEIQPDFFAKGFEFVEGSLPPLTQEELDIISDYGGEMLFTPGDVVYSSTKLIDVAKPEIQVEQLISLMHSSSVSFNQLVQTVSLLSGFKVHVIGDTIVDGYTYTSVIGSKAKTPTLSVQFHEQTDYVGAAGIVSCHLKAAGADVEYTTVLGDDALKDWVIEQMKKEGVSINAIVDSSRPTTRKNAIIAEGYRLLKIDTLDNRGISSQVLDKLCQHISGSSANAVIFSDFRHGIFNKDTVLKLSNAVPDGVFRVADSQVASRWGNITEFKGFNLITPNENEGRFALGDQDSVIGALCTKLVEKSQCEMIILKLGKNGVLTSRPSGGVKSNHYFAVDSFTNDPVDPVGAGDALLSYATLSMLATNNEVIATIIGSIAAACECEQEGNVPVTPEMIIARIEEIRKACGVDLKA
jgi:rfaE bifunctional protein kinase chain/domain/rfaE bifunctional protein nucleotidyltransferase chain/domain